MENNNVMETENFYYEDIVEGINILLTKEILEIFNEAGISKKEILVKVEENLPPIFDSENLDSYCKRFLQFILINQLNSNFAENIDKKAKMNDISSDEGNANIDAQMLKKYMHAYNNGDYAGIYNVICNVSAILTLIGKKAKQHYMDRTEIKVYQKYINDYRKKLLSEFSKISIPQPEYEEEESLFKESDEVIDEIETVNVGEDIEKEEVEDDIETDEFENTEITDEINDLDDIKDASEDKNINTDSILASIDELDDDVPTEIIENEDVKDELPGLEEEVSDFDEEDTLPGFDEEETEEIEDELPGLDEEVSDFDEEDTLPGFDEEETEEIEDELPGLEEEVSDFDEEDTLPGFDEEKTEEIEDELPGLEDDEVNSNKNLSTLEEELSDLEQNVDDDLSGLYEKNIDDVDETLPGVENDSQIDENEQDSEIEENLPIDDERRKYDLAFEDNYYDIQDVSSEYLEAHPDYKNAKFIEATGGTNLDDFISTMLYLKDTEKTEIVGIFNNVILYTHNLYTVDDIESVYDKLVEEIDEEDGIIKSKSECISYDEYYNQFIQRDISRQAVKYQQEHQEIKMILIPHNNATIEEFVEAALYFIQEDMTGTVLRYGSVSIFASDYSTKEDIIKVLTTGNKKEKVEKVTQEIQGEIFNKSPEYYKSIAKISKSKTDAYRQRHPGSKKVMIVVQRGSQTLEDFFESVRYYNSINKNIIAQYDGVQLIVRKYNSAEEMIEAYKIKKLKK